MINRFVIAIGVLSLAVGVVSRLLKLPVPPVDIEANALLQFSIACFLLSIALSVNQCRK